MKAVRTALNRATRRRLEGETRAIADAGRGGAATLQLARLNAAWKHAVETIPAYRALADRLNAADGFASLSEFAAKTPVLEKADLAAGATASAARFDFVRRTGGATGAPTHLPAWRSEHAVERASAALARTRHGLALAHRVVLIWGHTHLLGDGWRGRLNAVLRMLKDRALGYTRLSAYDVTPEALDRMADRLARARADYVLGYAHALDDLARTLLQRGMSAIGPFNAVIATAEALPFADSVERIEAAFGAPLLLEYGAVETGPIAYARARAPYEAIWSRFLLEAEDPKAPVCDLLVTALYPRATPLFRYRIGDCVRPGDALTNGEGGLLTFASVCGRSNQRLILPSGRRLHSEAASHVFRANASIRRYQVAYGSGRVVARYVAQGALDAAEIESLRRIAWRIDPEFGAVLQFQRVDEAGLVQSPSGKFPMVASLPQDTAP